MLNRVVYLDEVKGKQEQLSARVLLALSYHDCEIGSCEHRFSCNSSLVCPWALVRRRVHLLGNAWVA